MFFEIFGGVLASTGMIDLFVACGGNSSYLLNHLEITLNADYGYAAAA